MSGEGGPGTAESRWQLHLGLAGTAALARGAEVAEVCEHVGRSASDPCPSVLRPRRQENDPPWSRLELRDAGRGGGARGSQEKGDPWPHPFPTRRDTYLPAA